MVNCGSDARHLLPSPLFTATLPRTTTRSPIPVHVLCEGPGPERAVVSWVCWRVRHPREALRGDIWAGMKDEAERSSSAADLKLRGQGWRGCHLGCPRGTESKAGAEGRRAGRRRAHQIVQTPGKAQDQACPEASPSLRRSGPYIPVTFVLLKPVRVLFYLREFDLDFLSLTTQSLLRE